ncbi:3418_t:CDS:1, partial [Racocetra fulgida]
SVSDIPEASTNKKKYSICGLESYNAYIYLDFIDCLAIDINEVDDINKKRSRMCGLSGYN